jgi:hypothetical protein
MSVMEMDVEGFLGHTGSAKGGSYLANWKRPEKGGKGYVDVVLHRSMPFSVALWRHSVPGPDAVEDKQTGDSKRIIRHNRLLCPDSEEVCKKAKWHERDSGLATLPAVHCPIHKLVEHVYQLVQRGKLSIVEPVFHFDVGDGKPETYHAGGITDLFGDDLSDEELRAMADRGIYQRDAWKQTWHPKLEYMFKVVDIANVGAGCVIATEPNLLGDKMKIEIRKAMTPGVWGPERGNPIKNPYVFRWEAHPEQQEFGKKYEVIRMEGIGILPAVMELVTNAPPPDMGGMLKSPNWQTIRSQLERHCQIDLPWDEFFGDVPNEDKKIAQRPYVVQQEVLAQPTPGPHRVAPPPLRNGAPAQRPAASPVQPRVELCACDGCGKAIEATVEVCPHCAYRYVIAAAPAPAPLRKRSEMGPPGHVPAPGPVQAPAPPPLRGSSAGRTARVAPAPVQGSEEFMTPGLDPQDDIPFAVNETLRNARV